MSTETETKLDFVKVVNPCTMTGYNRKGEVSSQTYCKITYKDGKLSITGVVGPMIGGDATGPCGQIYPLKPRSVNKGWAGKIKRFNQIWKDWHLNDMTPHSPEMEECDWCSEEAKNIKIAKVRLSLINDKWSERRKIIEAITEQAIQDIIDGELKTSHNGYNDATIRLLKTPNHKTVYCTEEELSELRNNIPEFMEISKSIATKQEDIDWNSAHWTSHSSHPLGMLGRKVNPDDEHGYGGKWWFREVPDDVIEFLKSLPDTERKPAWV
jgi:hypothetical protein|tara:strand:+ start:1756 stop:2559 length:804 start_codon:yes stop_codon:yes gene_type:complete